MSFNQLKKKSSAQRQTETKFVCLSSKSQGWGKIRGVELVYDIEQVVNYFEWVPRDALKHADFAQGGWSRQFGLGQGQDTSEVL